MKTAILLQLTRRNAIPFLWERGGATSDGYGTAQVLCDRNGLPKKPLFENVKGHLSCQDHAMIPLRQGDHVIMVDRNPEDQIIQAFRIETIDGFHADVREVFFSTSGNIEAAPPFLRPAIRAAVQKSRCHHCREAHYTVAREREVKTCVS